MIVDPSGRPVESDPQPEYDPSCPRCGGTKRESASSFGPMLREVCAMCGFEFSPVRRPGGEVSGA